MTKVIRFILSATLMTLIYEETGVWTTIAIGLIIVHTEITSIKNAS